jgi:hypothetical protein
MPTVNSVVSRIGDIFCPLRSVFREARRAEAERKARVEVYNAAWCQAHPDLVAQGCPPPPTRDSLTMIGVMGYGVFYQP